MTDVLESLRRYADELDTVEPVRVAEAYERADWSPYAPSERVVLTAASRPSPPRRRVLAVAAALVTLAGVAAVVHESATGTTRVGSTPPQLFLPATMPAGLHLVYKTFEAVSGPTARATLTNVDSGSVVDVSVTPDPPSIGDGDFTDQVDVNGHEGSMSSSPYGPDVFVFSAAGSSYTLTGNGASDDDLLAIARAVRPAGRSDVVDVLPLEGWKVQHVSLPARSVASLSFVDDGIGVLTVSVHRQPGGGAPLAGSVTTDDGGPPVSIATRGEHQFLSRRLSGDEFAIATAMDMSTDTAVSLMRALVPVSQAVWDSVPIQTLGPYLPPPSRFARILTDASSGVSLDAQAGPDGSWCLRVEPSPATTGISCMVSAASIRMTTVSSPSITARAVYGTTPLPVAAVSVGLDNGTEVRASLAVVPDSQGSVGGWVATYPPAANVRWVEAVDGSGQVVWHLGRPRHTPG